MKHQFVIAHTTAATVLLIYILCALAVIIFPQTSLAIAGQWFHGIDITPLATRNSSPVSLLTGAVTATAGSWLVGFAFASFRNFFLKQGK